MRNVRGFTIIEAVVAVAASTIVLGLLLDAFVESNRQSQDVVENQNARQEALIIAQRVERVLRFRVNAADMATSTSDEVRESLVSGAETFSSESLRVCSLASGMKPERILHTIANERQPETRICHAVFRLSPMNGSGETTGTTSVIGQHSDRFNTEVTFKYLTNMENLHPTYSDSPGSSATKLVQYRVRVWPRRDGMRFDESRSRAKFNGFEIVSAAVMQ